MNQTNSQEKARNESAPAIKAKLELPIKARRESILEKIDNSDSVILVGETGSGKTTMTPQYLLEKYPDKKIAVTSPRVFPARSVSKYVAQSVGCRLGGEVGLLTRQDKQVSNTTRLTFMTDGIILNMLRKDPLLLDLDIVMVDEAHERTINIDLLLGLLKQAQRLRKKEGYEPIKVIVASATIEEDTFTRYFDEAPLEKVPGRMYPVEVSYHPRTTGSSFRSQEQPLTEAAADLALQVLRNSDSGDILIFMPGEEEIRKTIECIERGLGGDSVLVLPLYGAMNPNDQDIVFNPSNKRKIIVSTNIAETSVTIDGVEHVIDSGLVKEKKYNPETGINSLELVEVSQANMNQRMGRAGRTAPGHCYRLMSEFDFENREPFQKAEILRSDLAEVVLRMKEMEINDVENFDFIEKPERERMHAALLQLTELGALDERGFITEIGREMAALEVRPDISRMLIEAKHHGVVPQMVNLCAMLSSSKPALISPNRNEKDPLRRMENEEKKKQQDTLRVPGSDLLTLLNVWNAWIDSGYSYAFANSHLLNTKALAEVDLIRMQLLRELGSAGITNTQEIVNVPVNMLIKCILSGVPGALFFGDGQRRYYNPIDDNPFTKGVQIFPGSAVFKDGDMLMVAMNIHRSEKMKADRYGGETKVSTLYARTCHNLTIANVREILGDSAVEEIAEGEPKVYSWGGEEGVGHQSFTIKVLGKVVGVEVRKVTILERLIPNVLWDIHRDNETVMHKYADLVKRAGYVLPKRELNDMYRQLISSLSLTTREDLEEHAESFRRSLDQLIPHEEVEAIERDSPSRITVDGYELIVSYISSHWSAISNDTAEIHINNEDEFNAIEHAQLPPFPRMEKVVFSYHMIKYSSRDEVRKHIESEKRWSESVRSQQEERNRQHEAVKAATSNTAFANLRKLINRDTAKGTVLEEGDEEESGDGDGERRARNVLRPSGRKEKESKKKLSPDEQVVEWNNSITVVRSLLPHIKKLVEERSEKVFKDRQTVLDRIKELRTESNALLRAIETDGYTTSREGSVNTFLQACNALLKRAKIEQSDTMFDATKTITTALLEALDRNEVDITDELRSKIEEVSALRAISGKQTVTEDEADEIIIEMV